MQPGKQALSGYYFIPVVFIPRNCPQPIQGRPFTGLALLEQTNEPYAIAKLSRWHKPCESI